MSKYIVFKGDILMAESTNLKGAEDAAKDLLPIHFETDTHLRPSRVVSIYQFVKEYGM